MPAGREVIGGQAAHPIAFRSMTSRQSREKVAVAIVGAGAAGSLLAARFAEAGRAVVVLEAGPAWGMHDLISSQIWARRLKWGAAPVERVGRHPLGHNMATGWGLGGAALHHYAGWPRLHAGDFRMRSLFGQGLDWPLTYDDLRPHYDRLQAEVGISGDADAEVWRPPGDPYPMPPLKWFRQGELIAQGFAALGQRVAPAPMAINSQWYKDRPPCVYDGWCDAGCPIYALANPLATFLPRAEAAGAVILSGAQVTQVLCDGRGRPEALHFIDAQGTAWAQPADLIILAGAAVQNARLLLASASPRHPAGLGNSSGLVGRYFSCHALANIHALFREDTECHLGMSAGGLIAQDHYDAKARPGAFGSYQWGIAPAVKPNDLLGIANTRPELFGPALAAFIADAARHLGVLNGMCETVPQADNRIELSDRRDRFGMPLARVRHSLTAQGEALWRHVNGEGLRVMRAAGARQAWASPVMALAHPSGGAIMGDDPARSVTDSYGALHDAPNVLVAGAGLFPGIGAVSPTFTVLALADRTAARVLDH